MSWKWIVSIVCVIALGLRFPRQLSWQLCEQLFPRTTTHYAVYASAHLSEEIVHKQIPEGSVWALDTGDLARKIQKLSYWIKSVSVARRFPRVLVVTVIEHDLIGVHGHRVIDVEGKIIELTSKHTPSDLPQIGGSVDINSSAQMRVIKELSAVTRQRKPQVQSIVRRPYGGWDIKIYYAAQLVCVRLPAVDTCGALKRAYNWLEQNAIPVTIVDLRCSAPIVSWVPVKRVTSREKHRYR